MLDLNDEAQLLRLKTELISNPKLLAYAGKTDADIATLLNTVGASNEKQTGAGVVPTQVLMSCIVLSEWLLLQPALQQRLSFWFSAGSLDTGNSNVREAVASVFGGGTQTQANLLAAVDKPISRGESLFGVGTVVYPWDVGRAKALP